MVFGHHPVYSANPTHGNTPEMIAKVKPLLDKYHVNIYFCGHDHDFQHLRAPGSDVDYIVTGTGSEVRPTAKNSMTQFNYSVPGFSLVTITKKVIKVSFIDYNGNVLYSMENGK